MYKNKHRDIQFVPTANLTVVDEMEFSNGSCATVIKSCEQFASVSHLRRHKFMCVQDDENTYMHTSYEIHALTLCLQRRALPSMTAMVSVPERVMQTTPKLHRISCLSASAQTPGIVKLASRSAPQRSLTTGAGSAIGVLEPDAQGTDESAVWVERDSSGMTGGVQVAVAGPDDCAPCMCLASPTTKGSGAG